MSTPDREAVLEGIDQAMEAQGYATRTDLNEAIYKIVEAAKATSKKARGAVAIHKDALMSKVFNTLPGPAEWGDEDDPALAEAVYMALRTRVWSACRVERGPIQIMLGDRNGHWLCRLGGLNGDSVYTTADWDCLDLDVVSHVRDRFVGKAEKDGKVLSEMSRRLPEHKEEIAEAFDFQLRAAVLEGRSHLALLAKGDDDDE
jgi:hypothetical protein